MLIRLLIASLVVTAAACALPPRTELAKSGGAAAAPATSPSPSIERQPMQFDTPAWREIDKLVDEQKLEAARTQLTALRDAAQKAENT